MINDPIKEFLIHHIEAHPSDIATVAAKHFGISPQAVNRHLRHLVGEGVLLTSGNTRGKRYALHTVTSAQELKLSPGVQEDKVWHDIAEPVLRGLPANVLNLLLHGFSEITNNAIEHSEGDLLTLGIARSAASVTIRIHDNGVGIFRKVTRECGLDDERHAILELSKGKLTTSPEGHTGEGIFFTSRMFNTFSILSGSLLFHHALSGDDWLIDDAHPPVDGTFVEMRISTDVKHTPMKIFDQYAIGEDHGFARTRIPVVLARYGQDNLVSRSQARRLLARVDRFREVVLNFKGVPMVGQAFADEIFRVFQNAHPEVHLSVVHTSADVRKMISHVTTASGLA